MPSIRFRVDARDVPPAVAAKKLGLDLEKFERLLPELLAKRKFPAPDPTTGNFDLKAIDAWQDQRHNSQLLAGFGKDSSTTTRDRLRLMGGGK